MEEFVREQVIQLLPQVPIGTTAKAFSLPNMETIFWADTAADRDLGTVTVVGTSVSIRLHFQHADWSFGDGDTDRASEPGKPYDTSEPCTTKLCDDYYGHVYSTAGPMRVTLAVTWTAQFSTDAGATWQDVAGGPLTGPQSTATVNIREARTVLTGS